MKQFDERLKIEVATEDFFKRVKNTSVIVEPSKDPNETAVFRSALFPNELQRDFPELKTMEDVFAKTLNDYPDNPFLGTRYPSRVNGSIVWSDYQFKTFKQFHQDRTQFGAGVMHLYKKIVANPLDHWFMGIFSINRYEWVCSEMGLGCYGIPSVALYDTLGKDAAQFILNHAEVPVCCASMDNVPALLELANQCPILKVVVVFEPLLEDKQGLDVLKKWGKQVGIHVVGFKECIEIGKQYPLPFATVKPSDIIALQYTSGTTGNPKGALLTHENVVSNIRAIIGKLPLEAKDINADCFISYLPLAHIMERCAIAGCILSAVRTGFFRGDISMLIEDIQALKPTVFVTVPRLLNRVYDKILQQALHAGGLKSKLFQKALDAKLYYLKEQGIIEHSIYDRLVFRKVRAALGGRVRCIITGSAPISPQILSFFRVCFSCHVLEGYGQTESTGGVTLSYPFDYSDGNVGAVSSK
jgi:long-chain acyl-CoA synthetase